MSKTPRKGTTRSRNAANQMVKRRAFVLGVTTVGCAGSQCEGSSQSQTSDSRQSKASDSLEDSAQGQHGSAQTAALPRRALGSSGHQVSLLGLGGYHLGIPSEKEALRIMHRAIDEGMTFFDNCWDYHDGESERRMGKALQGGRRDQVFLMTKIDGRTKQAAAKQIDDSLKRLRTDHVELMQIHVVIREEDPEWVFGDGGAIAALKEAKRAGKVELIGFTGHKSPSIHLSMLEEAESYDFRFDAVQMPLNALDPHYDSFEKRVLPVLEKKGIGVLGMKSLASGAALKPGVVTAEQCLRYSLSLDSDVVITGCDSMDILEQALRVGRDFSPLSEEERSQLLAKTRPHGVDGQLEGFKTSTEFDATARNRHWLTSAEL